MPKFFDVPDSELGRVKRINENIWFEIQQDLLLWMANNQEGRALLCIEKDFPQIVEISKRHVKGYLGGNQFISDFRIGAKWANIIRYRWKEFQEMAQWYYATKEVKRIIFMPVAPIPQLINYTTSTFYPDPNPETTSVDSMTVRSAGTTSWADYRTGAGTLASPSSIAHYVTIQSANASANWSYFSRTIVLYDTSSIPDGDTIDSATHELASTAKGDSYSDSVSLVTSTPASNTDVVTADYQQYGTTKQASDKTISSYTSDSSTYNAHTLNANGLSNIDKTGITKLGLKNTRDNDNNEPSRVQDGISNVDFMSADRTGTSTDPKLVVVHTIPFQKRSSTGGVGYFSGGAAYF